MASSPLDKEDSTPETRAARIAREIRRAEIIRQIEAKGGIVGRMSSGEATDIELKFLERVMMWETGATSSHRDWLARRGLRFPPPDELSGQRLKAELWRLIRHLAEARVFLEHTDHLADSELYRRLWTEVLSAECPDGARTERDTCHWDFADSGEGGEGIWLRFYASDIDREEWKAEFPDTPLPPREKPPFDRDRRLPACN